MNRIAIFFLFFLLPVLCLAEEKVYSNADLKSHLLVNSKAAPSPSAQQQQLESSNNRGYNVPKEIFEKREPVRQPNAPNPQLPQAYDDKGPTPDIKRAQPTADFNPVNPFPGTGKGTIEQMLAEACAKVTLFLLIVIGIPLLIWLICLIDILRNEFTGNNKIIWFLVVLFLPFVGAVLYFFIGTDQKIKPEDGEEQVTRLI